MITSSLNTAAATIKRELIKILRNLNKKFILKMSTGMLISEQFKTLLQACSLISTGLST